MSFVYMLFVLSLLGSTRHVVTFRPPLPSVTKSLRIVRKMSTSTPTTTAIQQTGDIRFGNFVIPTASVFYRSNFSYAFVNLRPILPGHVLVVPHEIVPTMEELTEEAYLDVWITVRTIQNVLRQQYRATAFNVAVQDGRAAGQTVPHVHVHILPRRAGDYKENDEVYQHLEEWAPRPEMQSNITLAVPHDVQRRDRTRQEMADEAEIYRSILQNMSSSSF